MASFSGPKLSNRIADDVPDMQAMLSSLAKLTPDSGNTDYPIGTKRVAETTNGYEFQQYNGTGWVTLEKWNLDAQKVDGYSASTGTTANTIPVRNANGKLPGDILGNAATATKATALSDTNPIATGGTGATTAEQARANLGTPPKAHASTSTEYGAGTPTQYGHLKSHDEPDSTLTAATGHAFSPAGAASMKTALEEQIEEVETEASTQVSSLDSTLRAFIAEEVAGAKTEASSSASSLEAALRSLISQEVAKCYPKSGGVLGGTIIRNGFLAQNSVDDNLLIIRGGTDATSAYMGLCGKTHSNKGMAYLQAANGTDSATFSFLPSGAAVFGGNTVVTLAASWKSGKNWYRKYSDGWIEQGGTSPAGKVTLHLPFSNTNYTITHATVGWQDTYLTENSKTTTGFTISQPQTSTSPAYDVPWYACGY